MSSQQDRLDRARLSLEGLSVGDAFGERFFVHPDVVERLLALRALPAPPWPYTDDTEMALSIVAILRQHDGVDQDALAQSFASHYNPSRGYGPAMHRMLRRLVGYVTRFEVRASYLERSSVQLAGARMHAEYWIPAEDIEMFNDNIVGAIDVIASFEGSAEPGEE